VAKLKKAHEAQDIPAIDTAMNELNSIFAAASEEMYKAAGQANGEAQQQPSGQGAPADQEVTDVDFEEVKDDKK
jgi:molecular chaperone DnaK